MASWCTELNQMAMISPIMRDEDHGSLRGDVSMIHCMQSTWDSYNASICAFITSEGADVDVPAC